MLSDAPTDFVTVAPSASNVVYFAEYGELLRSNDFGAHWGRVYASASAPRRGQLAIDPANPDILYFEEPEGVFKLVVGHSRPTLVLKAPPGQSDAAIAVDPRNGRVFAARRGQIYSSTNGGATWRRSRGLPPSAEVQDLEVSPRGPAYVSITDHGVFRTTDGRRWRSSNR